MTDTAPIHDPAELTRYIETRYHADHRAQLPPLLKLAEMVEDLHESDPGVPRGLHDMLTRLRGDMEVHMKREEAILFPAIRKGGGPGLEAPILAMRADHDGHQTQIAEIRRLTGDLAPPDGACTSWATLYAGLAVFIDHLTEHMRLEEEILLPQVER